MTAGSQRKNWILAKSEPALAESIARELVLARPLAQVLINRGYRDVESASKYLNPQLRLLSDPFDLPDMSKAVEAVMAASQPVAASRCMAITTWMASPRRHFS